MARAYTPLAGKGTYHIVTIAASIGALNVHEVSQFWCREEPVYEFVLPPTGNQSLPVAFQVVPFVGPQAPLSF